MLRYAEVVEINLAIAQHYGQIKNSLRASGKPIPDNDLWIASTAIANNLALVTRDTHFASVPGLAVESW